LKFALPVALVAAGFGCAPGSPRAGAAASAEGWALASLGGGSGFRQTVGVSVQGRAIEAVRLGTGPDVVLILASIHGSEGAGTPLVEMLIEHLERQRGLLSGRTVVVVPRVNPDGLATGARFNARGVDLNRNYPAGNFAARRGHGDGPLSEPESRAILSLLEQYRPSRIVSIHQPLACIDYDGPGRALAEAMAGAGDLPVKKLGARPGSLGAFAGETLGIPIITLELPGGAERLGAAALWARYGPMLLVAVEGR